MSFMIIHFCLSTEYRIEVLAAEFSPHTTSDGAAGYWEPIFMDETPEDKVEKWAIETYL